MMTEQPLTQWMDAYGTEIFRLCYLCLKDYHLAQDAEWKIRWDAQRKTRYTIAVSR